MEKELEHPEAPLHMLLANFYFTLA